MTPTDQEEDPASICFGAEEREVEGVRSARVHQPKKERVKKTTIIRGIEIGSERGKRLPTKRKESQPEALAEVLLVNQRGGDQVGRRYIEADQEVHRTTPTSFGSLGAEG